MDDIFNQANFDAEWRELAQEISRRIVDNSEIQSIKKHLQEKGFLTLEQKSEFIAIADKTKYDLIYEKYGQADSESFQKFRKFWQEWLKEKGVASANVVTGQEENISHFLYGSTPDPERFLKEVQ